MIAIGDGARAQTRRPRRAMNLGAKRGSSLRGTEKDEEVEEKPPYDLVPPSGRISSAGR